MSDKDPNALFERFVQSARDNAVSYTGGYRFNQLLDAILTVDASKIGSTAVFYHGKDANGVENYLKNSVDENSYIIDHTPLASLLERAALELRAGALTEYE